MQWHDDSLMSGCFGYAFHERVSRIQSKDIFPFILELRLKHKQHISHFTRGTKPQTIVSDAQMYFGSLQSLSFRFHRAPYFEKL